METPFNPFLPVTTARHPNLLSLSWLLSSATKTLSQPAASPPLLPRLHSHFILDTPALCCPPLAWFSLPLSSLSLSSSFSSSLSFTLVSQWTPMSLLLPSLMPAWSCCTHNQVQCLRHPVNPVNSPLPCDRHWARDVSICTVEGFHGSKWSRVWMSPSSGLYQVLPGSRWSPCSVKPVCLSLL